METAQKPCAPVARAQVRASAKPVEAPVRRATVANLARLDLPFERLHDLRDRLRRIIAMEPVKVDHVRAEVAERGIEVRDDVGGLEALDQRRAKMVMGALDGKDDLPAVAARLEPLADDFLAWGHLTGHPVAVDFGRCR